MGGGWEGEGGYRHKGMRYSKGLRGGVEDGLRGRLGRKRLAEGLLGICSTKVSNERHSSTRGRITGEA